MLLPLFRYPKLYRLCLLIHRGLQCNDRDRYFTLPAQNHRHHAMTFPATRVNMLGSNFMRIIFKTNQRSHFLQEFLAAVTLLESLPFGFQLISQINVSPLDGIFIFELAVDLPCLCYLQLLFGMDR